MDLQDIAQKLTELQAAMTVYTNQLDRWEKELSELKDEQHSLSLDVRSYTAALSNLQNELHSSAAKIATLHEATVTLKLNVTQQESVDKEHAASISSLQNNVSSILNRLDTSDHQITALVSRTKILQQSIVSLNDAVKKIDQVTSSNDLLINKLDFAVKVIIGMVGGIAALVGAVVAGWEWLSSFFSK